MAKPLCSRVTTAWTTVATAVARAAIAPVTVVVLALVVAALAVAPRVPMVLRLTAATSLLQALTPPSVFARPPWPKRKENKHVAT